MNKPQNTQSDPGISPADITLHDKRPLHEGRIFELNAVDLTLPTGVKTTLDMISHPGAAAIVPVDDEGQVYLIRQYRYGAGGYILEVPCGTRDADEAPLACAEREVIEEAGVRGSRFIDLGMTLTAPGFTNERIYIYLALGLEPVQQDLDHDEVITVERWPLHEAMTAIYDGRICDAKSICALMRAEKWLKDNG